MHLVKMCQGFTHQNEYVTLDLFILCVHIEKKKGFLKFVFTLFCTQIQIDISV